MNFQERSYGGKLFRPRPEFHMAENSTLLIIATPWGNPQAATDFIETVSTQLRASNESNDQNVISMQIEGLNVSETLLRKAIFKAHDNVLEKFNDQVLSAGVEFICFLKNGPNITWFKVGAPFFCIIRDKTIMPLNHPVDYCFDYLIPEQLPGIAIPRKDPLPEPPFAPLPKHMLGTHEQLHVESGTLRVSKGDRFLFISRSYVPGSLMAMDASKITLDSATLTLAKDNEDMPFWIALGEY